MDLFFKYNVEIQILFLPFSCSCPMHHHGEWEDPSSVLGMDLPPLDNNVPPVEEDILYITLIVSTHTLIQTFFNYNCLQAFLFTGFSKYFNHNHE